MSKARLYGMPGSYTPNSKMDMPHLWHLACNAAFLIDLEWKEVDDFGYSFGTAAAQGERADCAEDG